ncbi:DNA alkylation repair protein [Domibacillus tundrae]|uniref:DNA alkylation repair protein n=1 Tax=Domibacillus tundrae TaxID=1587527 RepID=UPI000617C84B|nr:DNA alkylation repair protein [Domibacillus tundrae]
MADLKDLFNQAFVESLAAIFEQYDTSFQRQRFLNHTYENDWAALAFKQRVRRLSSALYIGMDKPYDEALSILKKAAPHFQGLTGIIFPDYVEKYGLNHWEESIGALAELTVHSTSEFAVRPFLLMDPDRMLAQMKQWIKSDNEHIRRLASEGARPRLPWGQSIPLFKEDPSPLFPLLEPLLEDPSLYVRKSVANHLNDISKTHPECLIELIRQRHGHNHHTDWILRHASRTLLKQGNPDILHLFGYPSSKNVSVRCLSVETNSIAIGGALHFSVELYASVDTKARIEYAIDYMKKSGRPSRKIFQLADTFLTGGQSKTYSRTQSFRNMTTRTHYIGGHTLTILVNGVDKDSCSFQVTNEA